MRPRKEIEDGIRRFDEFCDRTSRTSNYDDVIIELLLDVRDLLKERG